MSCTPRCASAWRSSATVPQTNGTAKLVPLEVAKSSGPSEVVGTSSPGASRSRLLPRSVYSVMVSKGSTAPTEKTEASAAGYSMPKGWLTPPLPLAAAMNTPRDFSFASSSL